MAVITIIFLHSTQMQEELSEQTPEDLPLDLSLLKPHKETFPAMGTQLLSHQEEAAMDTQLSSSQEEAAMDSQLLSNQEEAQRPVEESQLGPSMTHVPPSSTKAPIAFEDAQHVTPVLVGQTFE